MQFLNQKNILIIVGVVVVLALFAGIFIFSMHQGNKPVAPAPAPAPIQYQTRAAAPTNVVVPSQNTVEPANVAVPSVVSQGSPTDSSVKYRSFEIKADNNTFMPDTVIVTAGDTVDLNITAVDKDYDFTQPDFGFKAVISKGSTKRIEFGATVAGKFTFYCASCGGPASGPIGYLVIASH